MSQNCINSKKVSDKISKSKSIESQNNDDIVLFTRSIHYLSCTMVKHHDLKINYKSNNIKRRKDILAFNIKIKKLKTKLYKSK
jgi:hypothetical protein